MAPVGSRESLAAAIKAEANSVYFGIGKKTSSFLQRFIKSLVLLHRKVRKNVIFIHKIELCSVI